MCGGALYGLWYAILKGELCRNCATSADWPPLFAAHEKNPICPCQPFGLVCLLPHEGGAKPSPRPTPPTRWRHARHATLPGQKNNRQISKSLLLDNYWMSASYLTPTDSHFLNDHVGRLILGITWKCAGKRGFGLCVWRKRFREALLKVKLNYSSQKARALYRAKMYMNTGNTSGKLRGGIYFYYKGG